ncbi:MAG: recombinase family protein [Aristaeellaceae bacterium]
MRIRRIEATAKQGRLRVAAYCRVSTKLTEQEESLEVQQRVYERYIRSTPAWEFAGLYTDARSGLNAPRREGFMKMIEDARAGKMDMILCKSISRFSRNIVECQRYVEMLRSRNVTVLFEKEHIRTDDPTSNLIFSLMCAIAQDESRSISENMKTANRHRVEAGIYTPHRNQMLGYDVQDGRFIPNEDAWIVQHIFMRYAEGAGIRAICRELNEQGVSRMRSKQGFAPSAIQELLANESYVGDKRLQKKAPKDFLTKRPDAAMPYATTYLTDDHEAIISREVWEKVQARLREEAQVREGGARRQGNSHVWYGRILCGSCGKPYMRKTCRTKGAEAEIYHIWCCKGRTHRSGCRNPNVREDWLTASMAGLERAIITCDGKVRATM